MSKGLASDVKQCRGCGTEILIIKTGIYGNVMVEAEPVWIQKKSGGESFITIEGNTVIGEQVGDAADDPELELIACYRQHRDRCRTRGKAPRNRKPRPSGYR